jgi:predicted adenine nucleotide alpha hydrolase (AANH) superfamily ATPase
VTFVSDTAISPHKVQEKLKNFGGLNEKRYGVPYLARNFLKDDGFKESVTYTKEHGIYRQDYCGCYFSLPEGGPQAQKMAQDLNIKLPSTENKKPIENPFRGADQEHPYLGIVSPEKIESFTKSFFKKRSSQ